MLLTVGVGVHVCRCCGTVSLVPLWKPELMQTSPSGCKGDNPEPCCSTEVYVMDNEFCYRSGQDSVPDIPDVAAFDLPFCSACIFDGSMSQDPFPVDMYQAALPPGNILPFISQFRL